MTHKDIFTKFMIEYDKANVTSSYPSLTEYEIAIVLDKAYMALISQKVTGNNVRRAPFEGDIKSIADLQPLVTNKLLYIGSGGSQTKANNFWPKTSETQTTFVRSMPDNMRTVKMPIDMLYFVSATVPVDMHTIAGWRNDDTFTDEVPIKPMDNKDSDYTTEKEYKRYRLTNVLPVTHQIAKQFYASSSNIPWVKNPVCFFENDMIYLIIDPIAGIPSLEYTNPETGDIDKGEWMQISYIKTPHKFAKNLEELKENLKYKTENIAAQYALSSNYILRFTVDKYFGSSKNGALHIDDIVVLKVDSNGDLLDADGHVTSRVITDAEIPTYYIEFNPKLHDISTLTASAFEENGTIFGKPVKNSYEGVNNEQHDLYHDDSFKLDKGNSFAVIRKDNPATENVKPECSNIFIVTYDDVYRAVKNLISNRQMDADFDDEQFCYISSIYAADEVLTKMQDLINSNSEQSIEMTASLQLRPQDAQPLDIDNDGDSSYESDVTNIAYRAYNNISAWSYSEYKLSNQSIKSGDLLVDLNGNTLEDYYTFELNDVMAEELISLAISYALENVESPRLNAHLGMRGLEA